MLIADYSPLRPPEASASSPQDNFQMKLGSSGSLEASLWFTPAGG